MKSFMSFLIAAPLVLTACSNVDFSAKDGTDGISSCNNPNGCTSGTNDEFITYSETFTARLQSSRVDVLMVIDSSGSMATERRNLGARLGAFVSRLPNIDWRLCVTTTDASKNGAPLAFANGDKFLTSSTANAADLFYDLLDNVASGSGDEQGIGSSYLAVQRRWQECFRDDAALAVMILSDEDERSAGGYSDMMAHSQYRTLETRNKPDEFVKLVRETWGAQKILITSAIVIRPDDQQCFAAQAQQAEAFYGRRYKELVNMTGGALGDICANDYASQLQVAGSTVAESLASVVLKCPPVATPQVALPTAQAGTQISLAGDRLTFSPALPPGTKVDVTYRCLK